MIESIDLEKLANEGYVNAQEKIGYDYYCAKDYKKALYWYELAKENFSQDAILMLGIIYKEIGNLPEEFYYLNISSEANNPLAKAYLGAMYVLGDYVAKDVLKAEELFLAARSGGAYSANISLYMLYLNEYPEDIVYIKRGKELLLEAASRGYDLSNLLLAEHAIRFEDDIDSYQKYLMQEVAKGNATANKMLADFHYKYTSKTCDEEEIFKMYYAANLDGIDCNMELGEMYELGIGTTQDLLQSAKCYEAGGYKTIRSLISSANTFLSHQDELYFDADKGINLLLLASARGSKTASFFLGRIYYLGKFLPPDFEKAFLLFSLTADEIDEANLYLARIYQHGHGIKIDEVKSMEYLIEFERRTGNSKVAAEIAVNYVSGIGVTASPTLAFNYLKKAAIKCDYYPALFDIALFLKNGYGTEKNYARYIEILDFLIDNDYQDAKFELAQSYLYEGNSNENLKKAFSLYKEVADSGNFEASFRVALCYYLGDGIKQNDKMSFVYMKKAAEGGLLNAIKSLANYYITGIGTEIDHDKSYYWLNLALKLDKNKYYYNKIATLFLKDSTIPLSKEEAYQYAKRAYEKNNLHSVFLLGTYKFEGIGTAQQKEEGLILLKSAADNGYIAAKLFCANYYFDVKNGVKNNKIAKSYLSDTYAKRSIECLLLLASIYREEKEVKKYLVLLIKAGKLNSPLAQFKLANYYLKHGDNALARYWLDRSIKNEYPNSFYLAGCISEFGVEGTADLNKAYSYFIRGTELGSKECLKKIRLYNKISSLQKARC